MFKYKEIITNRITLSRDLRDYQQWGWEIVSHAVCPNNNISILMRKEESDD